MKLLTKEIIKRLPKLYSTENVPRPEKICVCKFFTPWTYWTWYVVEGSRQEDGDWLFFGLVEGDETEWGYFLLSGLESIRGHLLIGGRKSKDYLTIERDLHHFGDGKMFKEFHHAFRKEEEWPNDPVDPLDGPSKADIENIHNRIQNKIKGGLIW